MASEEAFVTLATNDSYGLGALVLGHSLRNSGTDRKLAILVTPGISSSMRSQLSKVFDVIQDVDVLDSKDATNLALLSRPELGVTLTKLHVWNLVQFKKAVFLDADCLVVRNVDELFEREELSAVSDVGWPDCFNTGVFVFRPSAETYASLIKFAMEQGSFDGGDQGLLNAYFSDWATKDIKSHLSFIYNMVATVIYSYAPAFKRFGADVKIVHFLGNTKPWHHTSGASGAFSPALGNFLQVWWNLFNSQVRGSLEPGLMGLAGQIGQLNLGADYEHRVAGSSTFGSGHGVSKQRDWESGNIDYLGADRFENIQKRIQETIQKTSSVSSGPSQSKQDSVKPEVVKQPSPPPATATKPQESKKEESKVAEFAAKTQPASQPEATHKPIKESSPAPTTVREPTASKPQEGKKEEDKPRPAPEPTVKQVTPPLTKLQEPAKVAELSAKPQESVGRKEEPEKTAAKQPTPLPQTKPVGAPEASQQSGGLAKPVEQSKPMEEPGKTAAKQPTPPPQTKPVGAPETSQQSVGSAKPVDHSKPVEKPVVKPTGKEPTPPPSAPKK